MLAEFEFVLVRNQNNEIAGIVTASDVAVAYGAMATPFFLIGELDKRLRQVLASSIEFSEVQGLCDPEGNRSIMGFNDLSIGDYQRVLENKEAWERVGWSLDRKTSSSASTRYGKSETTSCISIPNHCPTTPRIRYDT
jgi:hypothetical protein